MIRSIPCAERNVAGLVAPRGLLSDGAHTASLEDFMKRLTGLKRASHRPTAATFAGIVVAAGVSVVGCGTGLDTPGGTPPTPLFSVRAEATGSLSADAPLRAALAWTITSPELLECLDGVDVDGVLTFSAETLDADEATAAALQRCLAFSEKARAETASVAIEAAFPLALEIPVLTLPDVSLLSGDEGARLGIADVVIYEDHDGDDVFDETARGAAAFDDVVRGTSRAVDEEDRDESFIVYREGALSPVWKIFRAIYGCADPAPGFSTITIGVDDNDGFFCGIDDRAVPVALRDDIATLGCAPLGDTAEPVRADAVDGIPAGAAVECQPADGYYDVVYAEDFASVCPDIRTVALVGCDTTSEETCRATYWDLVGDEPGWWPCTFDNGEEPRFFIEAGTLLTTSEDPLFSLRFGSGVAQLPLDGMRVEIDLPGGGVADDFDLVVDDSDSNGAFNVGDSIVVRERSDVFNLDSVPGYYPVRLVAGDVVIFETGYGPPVAPPVAPVLGFTAADAPAVVTDGVDDLFFVTWTTGDAGPFAVSEIFVNGYLGGELPVGGDGASGHLVLTGDENGDGLFGRGDTLLVRETAEQAFINADTLRSFGSEVFGVGVSVPVGFHLTLFAGEANTFTLE